MSTFPFRMPEDLKAAVTTQAERAGVSLNQDPLSIVATHAGSQAETERYFAARAARSSPGRALESLLAPARATRPSRATSCRQTSPFERGPLRGLLPGQHRPTGPQWAGP